MIINISVKNKIAKNADKNAIIICNNSDILIHFDFDEEWSEYEVKTARFVYGNNYTDIVFEGNECLAPVIERASTVEIGVYAGNIHTTSPAIIRASRSILTGKGAPADPPEDVYSQIMELLNNVDGIPEATETDFGKLLYIDKSGKCAFLAIGNGLKIENGVLMLSGTVTPDTGGEKIAVLGIATLGQMVLGKGA